MSRRHRPIGSRAARVGQVIVMAGLLLVVAAQAGCKPAPTLDAAVRKPIDDYFRGFKTFDATLVVSAASPEMRRGMPRTPEELVAQLRGSAQSYGPVQSWSADAATADVDPDNGQALVTVNVTSEKVIHVMRLDLRRYEDGWHIYGIEQWDTVRNPGYDKQLPRDIGQSNPFSSGVK